MASPGSLTHTELCDVKSAIDKMAPRQHIAVLRIIRDTDNIKLNENRNGIHINMSLLSQTTIEALQAYIAYTEEQNAILGSR
jgi:hypothetical protein